MVDVIVEPDEHGTTRLIIDGKDLSRVLTDGGCTIELRADGKAALILHEAKVHARVRARVLTG